MSFARVSALTLDKGNEQTQHLRADELQEDVGKLKHISPKERRTERVGQRRGDSGGVLPCGR